MEHKWLRNFDANGVWTKSERIINVDGEEHDLDEYAAKHGIELPDGKKQINTDVEDEHGDLGSSHDEGSAEEHGDGDSEESE